MRLFKKLVSMLAIAGLLSLTGATAAMAGGKCSPGQHPSPKPGFKPGVCSNK